MRIRRIVQLVSAGYIVFIGLRFVLYINALKAGDMSLSKPGGVEGFLPISALLGLKQLIFTGQYDAVHAAGLTIFLTVVIMSIVLKKSFCSHICPVGLASEIISNTGKKLRIPPFIPVWVLKYLLLGFFIYITFLAMDLLSVQAFIRSPYNMIADYKMLRFFTPPSSTTVAVVAALILLTLVFRGFWCKYLCPYGALLGLVSILSPSKIKRDSAKCIDCRKCGEVCPAFVRVYEKSTVYNPDCTGCHDCIDICPVENCLKSGKIKHNKYFALLPVLIFLLLIGLAMLAGLWETSVSNEEYRYFMYKPISHP